MNNTALRVPEGSTALCSELILAMSVTWSSHSPALLPPPRTRASWPSAESRA